MSYRYIGNKTRVLGTLLDVIRDNAPAGGIVADLMCGTASVAESLKINGYRVIASDIMTYSFCHAWVRLMLAQPPLFPGVSKGGYQGCLNILNNVEPRKGFFYREYSPDGAPTNDAKPRKYLSGENAGILDSIIYNIRKWESNGDITRTESILLRHDLVLATNRVANIAGTYGHFRSRWSNGSLRKIRLDPSVFLPGYRLDHTVLQGPAESVSAQVECDLCYLDPPYMKRQYAANYHLIETVARMDEPEAVGVSGLRPWRDQYSDFCSKVKIWAAFETIFRSIRCPKFLISYSEDGLIPIEDLCNFFGRFGAVTLQEFTNTRFRSNDSELGAIVTEYLIKIER